MKKKLSVLLLVFLFLGGCASPPAKKVPTLEDLNKKAVLGEEKLKEGNYSEALSVAGEALKVNPYHIGTRRIQAIARVATGDLDGAGQDYDELLKGDYRNPEYWMDRGLVSLLLGDTTGFSKIKNALEITSLPLYFDKNFFHCYHIPFFYNLGVLAAQANLLSESERYFRKVWEFEKYLQPSHLALLRLYLTKKPLSKVIGLLGEWSKEKNFKTFVAIAHQFYLDKKEYAKGARCLLVGLKTIKEDFSLYLRLGYTLAQIQGLNQSALSALEKAKTIQIDNPQCLTLLGLAYLRENTPNAYYQAYVNFKSLTKLQGNSPQIYFYYGLSAQRIGKAEEAKDAYKKALGINPKYLPAYENLMVLYMEGQSYQWVVNLMEKEESLSPFSLANLAQCYTHLGYGAVGRDFFQKALQKASKKALLYQKIQKLQKGN